MTPLFRNLEMWQREADQRILGSESISWVNALLRQGFGAPKLNLGSKSSFCKSAAGTGFKVAFEGNSFLIICKLHGYNYFPWTVLPRVMGATMVVVP